MLLLHRVKRNLVGGFQDGDFVLRVDLCLDLLPDLRLVLEHDSEDKQENTDRTSQSTEQRNLWCSTESLLHLLGQLLRVLPDGLRQLRHWIQHQVVQNHLQDKERDEPERHADAAVMVSLAHCSHCRPMSSSLGAGPAGAALPPRPAHWSRRNLIISTKTFLILIQISPWAPPSGRTFNGCSDQSSLKGARSAPQSGPGSIWGSSLLTGNKDGRH